MKRTKWFAIAAVLLCCATGEVSRAGTPFFTDDPSFEPSGWEIDLAGLYEVDADSKSLTAPALTLNYSFTEHVQVILDSGVEALFPDDGPDTVGLTDTDLRVKWRLIDDSPDHWWPAISISPGILLPTAASSKGLGDGRWGASLPMEIGKTFGKTYVYSEIAYQHIFADSRESADEQLTFGTAIEYQLTDKLMIGAEIFGTHNLSDSSDHTFLVNAGGSYAFSERFEIQATIGRTLEQESRGGPKLLSQVVFVWFIP